MNILLLGATGYLGGNIACRLVEDGHKVSCVVRPSSDTSKLDEMSVQLISNELGQIDVFLKHNDIDWVINGACAYKPNVTLYGDILNSNLIFPLNVLNLAVKHSVGGVITIGTSLPDNINMYSFTKRKLTEFGEYLSRTDHLKFAELQLEMFYGGLFEPPDRFIRSCKEKLWKNQDIELTTGTQRRDIIRVEDVIGIISRLVVKNYIDGFVSLPIGSGENHSIREIVEYMKKTINSTSELIFGAVKSRPGEPDTLANIDWYKEVGYQLQYGYFEGLKEECKTSSC
jgi:CDP-paratose synthetase